MPGPSPKSILHELGTSVKSYKEVIHTQVQETAVGNVQRKRVREVG